MRKWAKGFGQGTGSSEITASHIGACNISLEKLPRDAREKVDAVKLATWVLAEAKAIQGAPALPASEDCPSMLPLLVFAYACNVLGSEQISVACKTNPIFRSLCEGRPPFPPEISSFRRHHREELETVLAGTLARVMQELSPAKQLPLTWLIESARQRLDTARHMDTP